MITKPIIVVGAPRSGTTILTRCLSLHPDLWHFHAESHHILEGPFHPQFKSFESNRVTAQDLSETISKNLQTKYYNGAINQNLVFSNPTSLVSGVTISDRFLNKFCMNLFGGLSKFRKPRKIRFLEKTPKNSLRIPMLDKLWPDALFIWNRRKAEENIDSLIDGWSAQNQFLGVKWDRYGRSGYNIMKDINLTDYPHNIWKFVLVPDWKELENKRIADAAALQYVKCNQIIESDLNSLDNKRIFKLQHEDFVQKPQEWISKILEWADLSPCQTINTFTNELPTVNTTKEKHNTTLRFPQEVNRVVKEYYPATS